jgi:hypothetical protein
MLSCKGVEMKITKAAFLKSLLLIAVIMIFFSCSAAGGGDDYESIPVELYGSWLRTEIDDFQFSFTRSADALLIEFTEPGNYIILFYNGTVLSGGQKGSARISGSKLVFEPSGYFDLWEGVYLWQDAEGVEATNFINDMDGARLPFALSGSTLSVTFPDAVPANKTIILDKEVFESRPAALQGTWANGTKTLTLGDSSHSAESDLYLFSGNQWHATGASGGSGFIRLLAESLDIIPAFEAGESLVPYSISGGTLTISWSWDYMDDSDTNVLELSLNEP